MFEETEGAFTSLQTTNKPARSRDKVPPSPRPRILVSNTAAAGLRSHKTVWNSPSPDDKFSSSPRTQARINIKVQSPVQKSEERLALSRSAQRQDSQQELDLPQVPPERGDRAASFDSFEVSPLTNGHTVGRSVWPYLWSLASIAVIMVLIPFTILLLPYVIRSMTPRCVGGSCYSHPFPTTAREPWPVSVEAIEYFRLPVGLSQGEFCRRKVEPDHRLMPHQPLPTMPAFSFKNRTRLITHRHLLCHLDTQYWRSYAPYTPSLLPVPFCSSLVLSGYAVDAQHNDIVWRPASARHYHNSFRNAHQMKQFKRNYVDMEFFLTIGGRREDSRNLSLVTQSSSRQDHFVRNINAKIHKATEGVHIDWNYPGDACSRPSSVDSFRQILQKLHQANIQVIISVPPDQSRIQSYNLNETVNYVHFVIVKTHVLVMPDIVACNGERVSSARVFNKIVETVNFTFRNKFGYSISVAPETFTATSSNLWVHSTGPSKWDNYTLQPGKAHLASVCQQQPAFYSGYTECFFISQAQSNRTFRVAALTPRFAIKTRIKRSYDDGMGIAPVMVYDIDLDDFEGNCSTHQTQSPILEQLATASY